MIQRLVVTSQLAAVVEDQNKVDITALKEFVRKWLPPNAEVRLLVESYDDEVSYAVWLGVAASVIRLTDMYANRLTRAQSAK